MHKLLLPVVCAALACHSSAPPATPASPGVEPSRASATSEPRSATEPSDVGAPSDSVANAMASSDATDATAASTPARGAPEVAGGEAHAHTAHASDAHGPGSHDSEAHGASHQHGGGPGMHMDFSDAKKFSKHFDDPARDAWQRPAEVIALLHIEPGSVVADLGSGTGYFVEHLSRAVGPNGSVLALDVEPNMVSFVEQRARERGLANVTAKVVKLDDPGLAPGSVARVLIVNTWHHIDARQEYAKKLAAALGASGEIWFVDFTLESKLGPPARHRLTAKQVVHELESGGLRAEVVDGERLPNQYVVRATRQ